MRLETTNLHIAACKERGSICVAKERLDVGEIDLVKEEMDAS
jgi:hypothetical protein